MVGKQTLQGHPSELRSSAPSRGSLPERASTAWPIQASPSLKSAQSDSVASHASAWPVRSSLRSAQSVASQASSLRQSVLSSCSILVNPSIEPDMPDHPLIANAPDVASYIKFVRLEFLEELVCSDTRVPVPRQQDLPDEAFGMGRAPACRGAWGGRRPHLEGRLSRGARGRPRGPGGHGLGEGGWV